MDRLLRLQWNTHMESLNIKLNHLRKEGLFCDATLVCNGKFFPVHKVILSSFSEYFKEIFRNTPCKHPYIILNDTEADIMEHLLTFIYSGVVKISENKLSTLVRTALILKVNGLQLTVIDSLNKETDSALNQRQHKKDGNLLSQPKENGIYVCSGDIRNNETTNKPKRSLNKPTVVQSRPAQSGIKAHNGGTTKPADSTRSIFQENAVNPNCVFFAAKQSSVSLSSQIEINEETIRKPYERISGIADFNIYDCTVTMNDNDKQSVRAMLQNSNLDSSNVYEAQEGEIDDQLIAEQHSVNSKDCEVQNIKADDEFDENLVSESLEFEDHSEVADDTAATSFGHIADALKEEPFDNLDDATDTMVTDVTMSPTIKLESVDAPFDSVINEERFMISENNVKEKESTNPLERDYRRDNNINSFFAKRFNCYVCNFRTKHRSALLKHIIIHTGDKPFKCNLCSYKCTRKAHLDTHSLVHTGERPFKCKHCSKTFTQKGNLRIHMGIHSDKSVFKCRYCPYATHNHASLKRHTRIHEGKVPYKCNLCNFGGQSSSDLKKHLRIHTGEKPFACDKCTYRAAVKTTLNRHMNTHKKA